MATDWSKVPPYPKVGPFGRMRGYRLALCPVCKKRRRKEIPGWSVMMACGPRCTKKLLSRDAQPDGHA